MNDQTSPETDAVADEDFETIGDYHRMAAHHFSAAAKHHLAAADADDEGHEEANARHALRRDGILLPVQPGSVS